jgi:flagellar protein FliO/FliZ
MQLFFRSLSLSSFLLGLLGVVNNPAMAQARGQTSVSASTGLLQIFLALAAVIGLMLLIAWLFKRIGPINSMNKVPMKVVGGLSIGNRERIMVIEIADQWLIVGVTAQQINTLSSMPKQEITSLDPGNNTTAHQENQFSYWLKKTLEKRNTTET